MCFSLALQAYYPHISLGIEIRDCKLKHSTWLSYTIHLSHGQHKIVWILKANKAVSFCLLGKLVTDDSRSEKRGVF